MKIENIQIKSNADVIRDPYQDIGRTPNDPYASSQDCTDASMYSDDADGCDLPATDDYRTW